MVELVEFLVKKLVDDEDAVKVSQEENENGKIIIHVTVNESDMGKVIGRNGKVASAIRTFVKSVSSRSHKKVFVKFGE